MEPLTLVLAWPLLFLVFGVVLIALGEIGFMSFMVWPIIIVLLFIVFGRARKSSGAPNDIDKLEDTRRWLVVLSIAAFLPLLMRYLLLFSQKSLTVIIAGLLAGFGLTIWAMFIKNNQVVTRANLIGGGITIVYIYFQLWNLGQGARIIAAAVGLIVAVTISIIKLRDRLT